MAAKKKTSQTKRTRRKQQQMQNGRLIGLWCLILLAVLMLLSLFGAVGDFGILLNKVMLGLLGVGAYILPIYILVSAGCKLAVGNDKKIGVRIWLFAVALVLLSAFVHIFTNQAAIYEGLDFFSFVGALFGGAQEEISGGVIGGLIAFLPYRYLSVIGAALVLGFALVLSLIGSVGFAFVWMRDKLFPYSPEEIADTVKEALPHVPSQEERTARREESQAKREARKAAKDAFEDVAKIEDTGKKRRDSEYDIPVTVREDKKKIDADRVVKALEREDPPIESVVPHETADERIEADKKLTEQIIRQVDQQLTEEMAQQEKQEDLYANYVLPDLSLLKLESKDAGRVNEAELRATARLLVETLASFNVEAKVVNISRGPSVTRYELTPGKGVRISKFSTLSDDLALALKAANVRIEAPIPGKGTIGVEVANKETSPINIRRMLSTADFRESKSKLTTALGMDISGNTITCDIAAMPHLLIAGTTGSGKSVCINTMLTSILYKARPDEVKMIMIDPKQVELDVYNGIPHLISPVVSDPKKAAGALKWAVGEMLNRYKLFSETGSRNIHSYNEQATEKGEKPMSNILIVIDELADVMMCAPHEVEEAICRLAQMARAAGMHLIVATQRPSVDVITGTIKANIPSRIAFAVGSQVDSRIILDAPGAEKLLGKGDMLYQPIGRNKALRLQGCFVSDGEIKAVTDFVKGEYQSNYDQEVIDQIEKNAAETQAANEGGANRSDADGDGHDDMLPAAVEVVLEAGQASVSLLQRRLKLGYSRAARIVDEMESMGIVGPYEGSKPRKIMITRQQWQERLVSTENTEG